MPCCAALGETGSIRWLTLAEIHHVDDVDDYFEELSKSFICQPEEFCRHARWLNTKDPEQ